MARRTNWLLLALSLVLALVSTWLVMHGISKKSGSHASKTLSITQVVVVTKPVLPHQVVVAEDVTVKSLPSDAVPSTALHQTNAVVGRFTTSNWYPGQTVVSEMVADPTAAASFALTIPKGLVAYTLPDDAVTGVDHLLSIGDRINILATFDKDHGGLLEKTVLHNVKVLYVDQSPTPSSVASSPKSGMTTSSSPPDTITIAVTEKQADALDYAYAFGILHVALRSAR